MEKRYDNAGMDKKKIPALRIALIDSCNLRCKYCPPKGENFINTETVLSTEKLLKLLNIFYKIGFRQFGFTGGEPLLRKDLDLILKECSKFKDVYLKLYTNGILLKDRIGILKKVNLIKLSLDSTDYTNYKKISGYDKLRDIFTGIRLVKKNNIKLRINVVLTSDNYNEIFELIDFCHNQGVDLKILDLNCFDMPGYWVWKDLYKNPDAITKHLRKIGLSNKVIYTKGNYGIPMDEFRYDGIGIRIKNTKSASVYAPICRQCRYFLCQEGLYHLTLTSEGKLKMCRHRPDISVDLNHKASDSDIRKGILEFLKDNYFLSKRINLKKQVFLGNFGIKGNNEARQIKRFPVKVN